MSAIQSSSRLWEQYGDAMAAVLVQHDQLIERLVSAHGGLVVRPRGDGDSRFAVFEQAVDAVAAACEIQLALQAVQWPTPEPVPVRMGLHTGPTHLRLGDYYGPTVNRCARIRDLARGGQVLSSSTRVCR